jgi:hypothetical protein
MVSGFRFLPAERTGRPAGWSAFPEGRGKPETKVG